MERSRLRKGDQVMVISGGNSRSNVLKGQVATIIGFDGTDRVFLQGLNWVTKHVKPTAADKPGGKLRVEASVHISNVMLYVDALKRPVRVSVREVGGGKRARGYVDPHSKQFVAI